MNHPGPERVGEVVVEVGDRIRHAADLAFERQVLDQSTLASRKSPWGLEWRSDSLPDLPTSGSSPRPSFFKLLDDPQALLSVAV